MLEYGRKTVTESLDRELSGVKQVGAYIEKV